LKARVLVVDDDRAACELMASGLRRRDFTLEWRLTAQEAIAPVMNGAVDVVVADLNMPGVSGIDLCRRIAADRPDVPVVVVTAFGSLETAVAAIRAGAYDFVTKPFEIEELELTLERAMQHRQLREEVKLLRRAVTETQAFSDLIGDSAPMRALYRLLDRIAESDATVLVVGESGTGKELVARALHDRGPRRAAPFVALNCAAISAPLLESELFGHVKGAFTDAKESRPGLIVRANGGTLLLDEVGEMPLEMQAKLLRALEARAVRPVGGEREIAFDVRLIAATNRDLETAQEEGQFRSDLYYRINVIQVALPPLRARGNDVLLLAQRFVEKFAARAGKHVTGLSPPAAERLLAYPWPGNVRELQNCIERAVALTAFEALAPQDLPERVRDYRSSHVLVAADDPSELVPMEEVERRYVLRVLEAAGGNKTIAARILGFNRRTMYRKLERYLRTPPGA
jgi:DNA-binding NtrC family response regulator